jgi:hypothetical protein
MLDEAQLERTLDLWSSVWREDERAACEQALARLVAAEECPAEARPQTVAALAACLIVATPTLMEVALDAVGRFSNAELSAVGLAVETRQPLYRRAVELRHRVVAVVALLEKAARQPDNSVADQLLERVDARDLWAALHASCDPRVRAEAAWRLARRGPHQRYNLGQGALS